MLQAYGTQQDISATRPDIANTLETTVMTVKDLEDRVELLKSDVFQLSTQLGHQRAAEVAATPSRFAALRTPGLAGQQTPSIGAQQGFAGSPVQGVPHASNPQQIELARQQGLTQQAGQFSPWTATSSPIGLQTAGSIGPVQPGQVNPYNVGLGTIPQLGVGTSPYAQQMPPQFGVYTSPLLAGRQQVGQPGFETSATLAGQQQVPQFGIQSSPQVQSQPGMPFTIQIPGSQGVGQTQPHGQAGMNPMQQGTQRII